MAKQTINQPKQRGRRTYKELFLAELKKRSGEDQKLVTNDVMRTGLGWPEARYKAVKDELVSEKTIIVGRGRGGLIGLAQAPGTTTPKALSLFISYSHKDEPLKDELVKHLSPLRRLKLILDWHDRKIEAGDKWGETISDNLRNADIIILLISIDFINSEYCYDIEMEAALERVSTGDAVMIPVIARDCMWKSTKFSAYQALPTDGKAITTWRDWDEALTKVVEGIRQVAEGLMNKRDLL